MTDEATIKGLTNKLEFLDGKTEGMMARISELENQSLEVDDEPVDDGARMELGYALERISTLESKVSNLTDELRSVERELDRKIEDVRSDGERADDTIKSDVESLRNDLMYGR